MTYQPTTDFEAMHLLHAAGIEAADNPLSYTEIAQRFGLLTTASTTEVILPEDQTEV